MGIRQAEAALQILKHKIHIGMKSAYSQRASLEEAMPKGRVCETRREKSLNEV